MKLYSEMTDIEKRQFKGYYPLEKMEGREQADYDTLLELQSKELKELI